MSLVRGLTMSSLTVETVRAESGTSSGYSMMPP
jgi:hypothetical protein